MRHTYKTAISLVQKELLNEYKELFHKYTAKRMLQATFDENKTRIQIEMCDALIEFDCKREAREAGVLIGLKELR